MRGLAAASLLVPVAALAQRTDDNAVREAEDGFGFSVGDEEIGIYNIESVRGFSPVAAGNIRIDGLYVDIRGNFTDALMQGTGVKVGITAIRTPLLAPSGIGEIKLKQIGARAVSSAGLSVDEWGSAAIEGETRLGRRDGLSLVANARIAAETEYGDGTHGREWHLGAVPRWQFGTDSYVTAYFGGRRTEGMSYGTAYYTQGSYVPARLERGERTTQPWNKNDSQSVQAGALADIGLGGGWRARAGLFRSQHTDRPGVYEFVSDVDQAGFGIRNAILSARYDVVAWSGEAQLVRGFGGKVWHGELMAAVRFRRVDERSGEGQLFALDAVPHRLADVTEEPEPVRAPVARDASRIGQVQPGLSARLSWRDRIALNLGAQKADYSKRVRFAAGGTTRVSSLPVIWNAALAVSATPQLTFYAGLAKGLEESGVAPDIAANARAALPAAITRQKDIGIAWKPSERFSLIAGAFAIERPYANLDSARLFRFLGALRNRGVEVSVVARPIAGLSVVAGALRQWPRLSGEDVASGAIGPVPVAFADYTANGGIDYTIPGLPGLSANASLNVVGPREARRDMSFRMPGRQTVNLGLRYRFRRAGADWVVNVNAGNVLNSYDWSLQGDGGMSYVSARQLKASLFADF